MKSLKTHRLEFEIHGLAPAERTQLCWMMAAHFLKSGRLVMGLRWMALAARCWMAANWVMLLATASIGLALLALALQMTH